MKKYTDEELAEYAEGMGISIAEAREQYEAMDKEAAEYAEAHGVSFEEAQTILAQREAEDSGLIFEVARMVEAHADEFDKETVEQAKKISKTKN